ncbi:nucleoside hydrolase-like domain-containing protein [Spirosoma sp.]|uniref:nucleoside hydrolase-like domain-containing protein n=1 Tax=Spirosoma sp. TaxID=1899569 RepID=UPI002612A7B3|nr:nucleoside hydrolase-like domain-containing protein [Spirosoma sp.]MCX6214721.1 DUF1593 domain-containing protein [Spirosoma sp.]
MKTLLLLVLTLVADVLIAQSTSSHIRLIVLTDIENEPDDSQSLVRLLTYANQIDIEGLIATTSIHLQKRVAPETIHRIVDAYGKVQPNLLKHEPGYPTAQALKTRIKKGLPVYGMSGVGEGKDSEGSSWIIRQLEKTDARPLWVAAWGGVNTLAQALWFIQKTRMPQEAERMYRKLRVYTISDQDDSGPWIRNMFPHVAYVVSPGYGYDQATWLGMSTKEPGTHPECVSDAWLAENIQQGHGPLGALYPDVAFGMEGDTPSFLGLIPNGLNVAEHPDWGGWGGRYVLQQPKEVVVSARKPAGTPPEEPETRPIWTNSADSVLTPVTFMAPVSEPKAKKSIQATIWRWRSEFQNDFAARMDWCTKPYTQANHPPVPRLSHPETLTVHSGETFYLRAADSTDPDGDSMSFRWMYYPEAGTYQGVINYENFVSNIYEARPIAPVVTSPQTIHFILKLTDKGIPALTRYKRVVVTVLP